MKKLRYVLLMLIFIIFPFNINAETYTISGTDVSIRFDDPAWYVFTRDNIQDNEKLKRLGLTYEYMDELMKNNNIYLDAALFNETDEAENIEMFIRIVTLPDDVGNLHTYSEKDIHILGDGLLESDKFNMSGYEIYGDKYKFIEFEYTDLGYNIYQFYTVINGKGYNFTTQKVNTITENDKALIKGIIDTVEFELDEYYEKPMGAEEVESSLNEDIMKGAIIGGSIGLIGSLIVMLKKKKNNFPTSQNNIQQTYMNQTTNNFQNSDQNNLNSN